MDNRLDTTDNKYKIFLKDKYGRIEPPQIGIYANTGYGKSLVEEGLVEAFFDAGCVCFYLGDGMKNKEEGAFAMFKPKEKYHLRTLEAEGKNPHSVPVKLYHPFTFSLPRNKIPNYNIFTVPINSLKRSDFSMLAETESSSATIKILLQSSNELSKNAGLYQWLWNIYKIIKKGEVGLSDASKNFYIPLKSGNAKDMTSIISLFKPFMHDYFLMSEEFKYNLDFKNILQDNKHIHYFSTKYLHDPKQKEFLLLLILNRLIDNEQYAKHPVIIIIPEIKKLCPEGALGYQRFLSQSIKEALSTMRNLGKGGYGSILSSQSLNGTDRGIRDSHSFIILGRLSLSDIKRVSDTLGIKSDDRALFASQEEGNHFWRVVGYEGEEIHFCFPSWMHKEPEYIFEDIFSKEYPEKMTSYYDLIEEMKKYHLEESEKFKELFKKIKESSKKEKPKDEKPKEDKQKLKELKEIEKMKDYERAYNMKEEGLTLEEIGKNLGTSKDSVRRWIIKFEKVKSETL